MFRKSLGSSASKMFRKGISTASGVSKGLGGASNVLTGAIKTGTKVANVIGDNPIVKGAIASSPEAQALLAKARAGAKAGTQVAGLLKGASELSNPANYRKITTSSGGVDAGAVQKNVQSGLQRAKDLAKEGESLYNFVK
jgi:hypothetical protein